MSIPFPGIDWQALSPVGVMLLLFCLRAADLTLAVLRVLAVVRGRPTIAWFLGFVEAVLFLLGAAGLLANLTQPLSVLAYAAGFATGTVLGMTLERIFLPANSLIRVYSPFRGHAITAGLRATGWGATEVSGRGLGGTVDMIFTYIRRRHENRVRRQVLKLDADAVVNVENVRVIAGGWKS